MDIYDDSQLTPPSHFEYCVETNLFYHNEQLKQKARLSMNELEGWCTHFKASILIDLVVMTQPQTVVEIGVWGGKSLIPMAYALKDNGKGKIYGIDPWSNTQSAEGMTGENKEWWSQVDHEAIFQGVINKVQQFDLKNQIELIRSTSENASPIAGIDILHIDGNHSEEASFYDVNKWVPLVKRGGLIIFDDTTWGTTTRAVEWLNANCIKIGEYHEDNDWGIWVKN